MTPGQHIFRSYDQQLQTLLNLILEMGAGVRTLLLASKNAFRNTSETNLADAKAFDKQINALDQRIEEEAARIIMLQNPMSSDLRFIISAMKIATILERAGDLAKNTIKRSVKMGSGTPEPIVATLEKMVDISVAMLDDALQAFKEKDNQKAARVWSRDDEIDALYKQMVAQMQQMIEQNPSGAKLYLHMVFAGKNLERLADYATNLAEMVYYVTSGKRADKATLKSLSET